MEGRAGRVSAAIGSATGQDDEAVEHARPTRNDFGSVYEILLPRIYRYFLARTGNVDDAAELSQQAFTQALAALATYRQGKTPMNAWIFRIARNLLVDHYRRHKPAVGWEHAPETAWLVSDDDLEASAIRQESLQRVRGLVARLDPQKRDLLALRFAGGLKVREIASVMNQKETTVRSQLRRVLLDLQEQYSHD